MNIQEALKPTGKATRKEWETFKFVYVKHGLYHYDTGEPYYSTQVCDNNWQPHHSEPVIKPEEEREVWLQKAKGTVHVLITGWYNALESESRRLVFRNADGHDAPIESGVIHNQNGWTRLHPPVEEDVERIEIEDIVEKLHEKIQFYNINGEKANDLVLSLVEEVLDKLYDSPKDKP